MGFGSSPKVPDPVPPPPPPPTEQSAAVIKARNDARQRAIAAAGASSTIATNAQGQGTTAPIATKTLLGQ